MAFVSVPKDLNAVKSKLAFNLTKRQLVCFGAAAGGVSPLTNFVRTNLGAASRCTAEKIALQILRWKLRPAVRTYKSAQASRFRSGESYEIIKEGNRIASNQKAKRRT